MITMSNVHQIFTSEFLRNRFRYFNLQSPPGETTATAEQSSAFETKQVLGYLWSVPLLKKHDKEVPRKLQSIQHQGKTIKGAILSEWVMGFLG